jgi:hypothetical protein
MILVPEVFTRVNDKFAQGNCVDASPILTDIKNVLIPGQPNNQSYRYQADFYKNFALDIVTETVFDYPYPCITEKTIRPIACKRMFILLGPAGVLDLLKSKGFTTFEDFVNEDYDTISDPIERFTQVVLSINEFLNKPLAEIKQYYHVNQQKFDQNFITLKNLRSVEYQQLFQKLNHI